MDKAVPPVEVSPLIKGARWGLLVAGILYGSARYNLLYKLEQKRLAEIERTRPEREAKAKALKEINDLEEMLKLEKEFGFTLK